MSKARKLFIAANWKMNPAPLALGARVQGEPGTAYQPHAAVDTAVFPTFLDIEQCIKAGLATGGQWGHPKPSGAFTGDVSMAMLKAAGCRYVLCGHSDRRLHHHESDAFVAEQALAALELGLHPVVCVGETLSEREAGKQKAVVERQIKALPIEAETKAEMILAYEPIWAIGTGKNATAPQAQEMHAFIRSLLPKAIQAKTRILYGGSVKGDNTYELLHENDIDGALVGGASLKPEEFTKIVEAAMELSA